MGTAKKEKIMSRIVMFLAAIALVACSASEVEDLGVQSVQRKANLGEAAKAKSGVGFGGALMTSGSFTMMAASSQEEEERTRTSSARPTTGTSPTAASARRA